MWCRATCPCGCLRGSQGSSLGRLQWGTMVAVPLNLHFADLASLPVHPNCPLHWPNCWGWDSLEGAPVAQELVTYLTDMQAHGQAPAQQPRSTACLGCSGRLSHHHTLNLAHLTLLKPQPWPLTHPKENKEEVWVAGDDSWRVETVGTSAHPPV
jgi:hypothetical protein